MIHGLPIVIFMSERGARWWRRRRPQWNVVSYNEPLAGLRSDRIVLRRPQFFVDEREQADYIRTYDRARTLLRFPGRLMIVDWRGIPLSILRHR